MIDFINKMRSKQEDDLHVCDMDVDKIIDESVTDVSQDSQVMQPRAPAKTALFCVTCRCLVPWSKVCVGYYEKHTLCSLLNFVIRSLSHTHFYFYSLTDTLVA